MLIITYSTSEWRAPASVAANLTSKNYISWHSYLKNYLMKFSKNLIVELHLYKSYYPRIAKL
jgi:hypothetical protein